MRRFTFRDRLTGSVPLDKLQATLVGNVVAVTTEPGRWQPVLSPASTGS
jgi:hypothetical protein